jgi:hypothetical protein
MSSFEDMVRRIQMMNSLEFKNDINKLSEQINIFLDKYGYKGVMGFYKKDKFTLSVLPNEEDVDMHINNFDFE